MINFQNMILFGKAMYYCGHVFHCYTSNLNILFCHSDNKSTVVTERGGLGILSGCVNSVRLDCLSESHQRYSVLSVWGDATCMID